VETNALYYGDNLSILRDFIPDASVDLVYLDPPFNSNRDYNLIFKDQSGKESDAQILAFEDTWTWGPDASTSYDYLTNTARHHGRIPDAVTQVVGALRSAIGASEMLAYLVEMTVRLVELRRVLKPTGTLYLHCDPTASHYLKIVLDAIFGPTNFRNEIIWRRTSSHNDPKRFGTIHDTILAYAKDAKQVTWNPLYVPYTAEYIERYFRHQDPDGRRFWTNTLTAPGPRPNLEYEWKGVKPPPGRCWAMTKDKLEVMEAQNRIFYTKSGFPLRKYYLDESPGAPAQDIWTDIARVGGFGNKGKEKLGFPTQKPVALLERIIAASSNEGDIVLDPFCGCGTALVASQKLGRRWVGIDVTYLAIAVMKARLHDSFGIEAPIIGAPTEVDGARALAEQSLNGRYQFQQWALTLIDAAPAGPGSIKKGADSGVDGRLTFSDVNGQVGTVIVSVKSGGVGSAMVSELAGVVQAQGAALGIFITLEEPTKPMRLEAAKAGEFYSHVSKRSYPKIQILTVKELLDGKKPEMPLLVMPTYQQAEKLDTVSPGQTELFG
jgi:site-specific DNA-methyltransferase (adenine-specific)